ncbi:hypothetical protein FOZ62_015570 [Perkinsus olseni]|uniref:Uncharacterized protein n=1 Tax=Perkinsus olseni TaxID=32597 RepID=A0A7J6RJL6_PEROL|nr:hypothetical protein FOZ62_015570 [Perkinsus olseni]
MANVRRAYGPDGPPPTYEEALRLMKQSRGLSEPTRVNSAYSNDSHLADSNFLSVPLEELQLRPDGSYAFHAADLPHSGSAGGALQPSEKPINKPVSTRLQVASRLVVTVILDSGSGKNLARTSTLRAIEASPGSKVEWKPVPRNESASIRGISGVTLAATRIALVSVYSPKRPHDVKRLRFFVSDDLLPVLLIGVEGMRDLRIALTFTPSNIRAYSGISEDQSVARVEESRPPSSLKPLVGHHDACYSSSHGTACGTRPAKAAQDGDDLVANIFEDGPGLEHCVFDGSSFLALAADHAASDDTEGCIELDHDFCYDLYAKAGNPPLPQGRLPLLGGPALAEALASPDCSFRGLTKDETDEGVTRFLHEFAWIRSRPSPSDGNRQAAKKRAERLATSLSKRGLLKDYTRVLDEYLADDLIVKVEKEELSNVLLTNHFPVIKETSTQDTAVSGRKTKIRPVFDWRVGNQCQRPGVVMDKCIWPFLAATRLFPFAIWCDLRTAFLRCRVTNRSSKCFGFVHVTIDDHGRYDYHYFRFRGLCMGNSGSPAALQLSAALLEAVANEQSAVALGGQAGRPLYESLKDSCAEDSEVEGLDLEDLSRPSQAANRVRETLQGLQPDNITQFLDAQGDMPARRGLPSSDSQSVEDFTNLHVDAYDRVLIETHHSVIAHSTVLHQHGGRRGRYMDDWSIGARSQDMASYMYTSDCHLATEFGHEFVPRKTKKSWEATEAEGMGLLWTKSDQLKCKHMNSASTRRRYEAHGNRLSIREVLSALHSCHDPLGYLGWSILQIKRILRLAYVEAKGLDDRLTQDDSASVLNLLDDFNDAATKYAVPRFVNFEVGVVVYSDASTYALGMYMCGLSDVANPYVCASRLVPPGSAGFSIVRKEQLALEWALEAMCAHAVLFPHAPGRHLYVLTDSKIVHYRVTKLLKVALALDGPARLAKYPKSWTHWEFAHARRCALLIKALGTLLGSHGQVHFHHCPSELNLADAYSRGMSPYSLDRVAAQSWLCRLHGGQMDTPSPDRQELPTAEADLFCYVPDAAGRQHIDDGDEHDIQELIKQGQASDTYCQAVKRICSPDDSPIGTDVDLSEFTKAELARLTAIFAVDEQGLIRLTVGASPCTVPRVPLSSPGKGYPFGFGGAHLLAPSEEGYPAVLTVMSIVPES